MSYVSNLRTFVRVFELGSMSAAARDQRISAAVASARIGELERHLGVRLFNRTTRSLQPTEHGTTFYGGACKILDTIGEAEAAVTDLTEPARLAPRRRAPRDRQAPDRAADSVLQGRVPGDRRPPPALGPQARHDGGGPRPRLPPRHARGLEPARPPDRRLPPRARRLAGLSRQPSAADDRRRTSSTSATTACCTATRAPGSSSGRWLPPTARGDSRSRARSSPTTATS